MSTTATSDLSGSPLQQRNRDLRGISRWVFLLIALGVALRVLVWLCSDGSNDADYFRFMAKETNRIGQMELYRAKYGIANHPPVSGYYAAGLMRLVGLGYWFPVLMKVPMLLADAMVFFLLWKIWSERKADEPPGSWPPERSPRLAAFAVAIYALNLVAILVGSFHCNTDIIYGAFSLLAIYLVDRRGLNFLGGLALAIAMNAKVIPLILILPLLLQYRSVKPALAFLAGIAVGMIPFYPFLVLIGPSFRRNVFSYKPVPALWGIQYFLLELKFHNIAMPYVDTVLDRFSREGRYMVMGFMCLIGLVARRHQWNRFKLACTVMACFLVLAPGFGVQYTILIVPMLCAFAPRWGLAFGTIAGLFIGWVYLWYRVPGFPIGSRFTGGIPEPTALLGLVAWLTLIVFLIRHLRTKPQANEALVTTPQLS